LDFDTPFNIFTGVTATGNNGVDYTSQMAFNTTSTAISPDGTLDTKNVGVHAVRYIVTVGTLVATRWRYITVNEPEGVEGEMLVNPNFDLGTAGWDSPSVVYIADGAAMTLSVDNGALKAEVVSGANPYTPRFGQMNVPFEAGKTYEISFDAKSSVVKPINLQVGELLNGAPYFTDFKPGLTVHRTIGLEWARYSYKFTMNQDNQRGGVLFELGTVDGQDIDATMWFDNIAIVESTPDEDTIAPVLSGTKPAIELAVNATFDPAKGVTAFDATDGDLTSAIVITFEDKDGNPITAINTGVPGTYYVIYTVEDAKGNKAEFVTEVTVKSLNFSDVNLVANPSFEQELNETTPEWKVWSQFWGNAPIVAAGIDTVSGVYNVGITNGGGDAAWAVQIQSGLMPLVQGETYRVKFTASSSVARNITVAVGWSDESSNYTQFGRRDGIAITTEPASYEFIFTVTPDSHEAMITFELGSQEGFAEGVVTLYDVALQQAVPEENKLDFSAINLIANPSFNSELNPENPEWKVWSQDWGNAPIVAAGIDTVSGVFNVGITNGGGDAAWAVQLQTAFMFLEQGKTYRVQFTASAAVARNINVAVGWTNPDNYAWTEFGRMNGIAITTEPELYEFVFTVAPESHNVILAFELGSQEGFAEGVFTLYDAAINQAVEFSDINLLPNGSFTSPLNETTPEWHIWSQDWGNAPVVAGAIDTVAGIYTVGISNGGGDAAWAIQLQSAYITLQQGQTYRVRMTMSASVARNVNVAIGWTNPDNYAWTEFGRMNGIALTTEATVYEFVFTVAPETHEVILVVEMGSMDGFAEGVVTIHEAVLNEAIDFQNVNLLANPSFESPLNETTPEWKVWSQNWGNAPTVVGAIDTVQGVYTVDITNGGGDAAWAIQLQSAFVTLEQGTTYRVKVTMSASAARTVNIAVGWTNTNDNSWTEFARMNAVELTDKAATTTIIFTAAPATHEVILVVEMGSMEGFAEGVVTVYDAAINAAVVAAPVE
jgi:hypothetical protein